MNEALDKLYKASGYFILGGILVAYFFFQAMSIDKPVLELVKDWTSWLTVSFTTVAQVITVGVSIDKGIFVGISSEEFKEADIVNNNIINYIENHREETTEYIRELNNMSRISAQHDFLLSVDALTVDDLTPKQLKKYKKVKFDVYTSEGLTTSLYYEGVKGKKRSYNASFVNKKGYNMGKKSIFGPVLGLMGITTNFVFNNLGTAIATTIILAGGMTATYLLNYFSTLTSLTKKAPQKVKNKETFYRGLKNFVDNKNRNKIVSVVGVSGPLITEKEKDN